MNCFIDRGRGGQVCGSSGPGWAWSYDLVAAMTICLTSRREHCGCVAYNGWNRRYYARNGNSLRFTRGWTSWYLVGGRGLLTPGGAVGSMLTLLLALRL